MKKRISFAILLLVTFSCKTDQVSLSDYKEWVNDAGNGLLKKTELDGYKVDVIYKPVEWLAVREIEKSKLDMSSFDSVKNEYKGLQYYGLKLQNENIRDLVMYRAEGNDQLYQQNFNYFSGGMKNDIVLVDHGDTLPCVLFHYERNYGASPVNIFNLAFENVSQEISGDRTLIVNLQYLQLGILKFTFAKEDLQNIPKLKFN